MKTKSNECCNCAVPLYPCVGELCPNRNVIRFVCDSCGDETMLYKYDGEELCLNCVAERLEVVKGSDVNG